jgi:hypothetical protein
MAKGMIMVHGAGEKVCGPISHFAKAYVDGCEQRPVPSDCGGESCRRRLVHERSATYCSFAVSFPCAFECEIGSCRASLRPRPSRWRLAMTMKSLRQLSSQAFLLNPQAPMHPTYKSPTSSHQTALKQPPPMKTMS